MNGEIGKIKGFKICARANGLAIIDDGTHTEAELKHARDELIDIANPIYNKMAIVSVTIEKETAQPVPPAESLHEMAKRMCVFCGDDCDGCPIDDRAAFGRNCAISALSELTDEQYEAQIAALRRWAAENPPTPVKTYRDDFFEKFPEAEKDGDGYPPLWVTRVYGIKRLGGPVSAGFKDAWDKPLGYWSGAEAKKDG